MEECSRSKMAQNSNFPRSQGDSITQVSEEIEVRVTKKLLQDFSRTENRILGALARLDDCLMNPISQSHFGNAPETSRNEFGKIHETNEDDSQSDLHPEAGIFRSQTTQNSGPGVGHDSDITDIHSKFLCYYAMPFWPITEQLCIQSFSLR